MKKNTLIKLVIVILLVIAVIIWIKTIKNPLDSDNQKLKEIYNKIQVSQNYLFEMKRNDNNKVIMAKKDDKTLIDQYSENNHTTTIVKDNNTYLVLHNREEYYIYKQNNVDQNILIDGIKEVAEKTYLTGTEKIKGKKYNYEEYEGSTIFMIERTLDMNEENIKTRFFFDNNNNLVYIKTMTANDQELLEVKLEETVNDSVFEIPSNYAEY